MPRARIACSVCGESMQPGPRTATNGSAAHAACRGWKARGSITHGDLAMYDKRHCRCDRCKKAKRESLRVYTARRKREDRPLTYKRKWVSASCSECGIAILSRADNKSETRFCSPDCAKRHQGWNGEPRDRWRPSAGLRRMICERDGWTCQLCRSPVRPDEDPVHPRYPNLDHIEPRAFGGGDEPENLRLLCRQCNVTRGTRVDWVPEVVHALTA